MPTLRSDHCSTIVLPTKPEYIGKTLAQCMTIRLARRRLLHIGPMYFWKWDPRNITNIGPMSPCRQTLGQCLFLNVRQGYKLQKKKWGGGRPHISSVG